MRVSAYFLLIEFESWKRVNSIIHWCGCILKTGFGIWSLWYLHPFFFVFSGLSKTGRGSRLEVLFGGVLVQFWSSATECCGKDCFSYDRVAWEQVSDLLDCLNPFSLGELFDMCLKLFICLALSVHLLEWRNKQADKYAWLLEFWLHCSRHSIFTYFYPPAPTLTSFTLASLAFGVCVEKLEAVTISSSGVASKRPLGFLYFFMWRFFFTPTIDYVLVILSLKQAPRNAIKT